MNAIGNPTVISPGLYGKMLWFADQLLKEDDPDTIIPRLTWNPHSFWQEGFLKVAASFLDDYWWQMEEVPGSIYAGFSPADGNDQLRIWDSQVFFNEGEPDENLLYVAGTLDLLYCLEGQEFVPPEGQPFAGQIVCRLNAQFFDVGKHENPLIVLQLSDTRQIYLHEQDAMSDLELIDQIQSWRDIVRVSFPIKQPWEALVAQIPLVRCAINDDGNLAGLGTVSYTRKSITIQEAVANIRVHITCNSKGSVPEGDYYWLDRDFVFGVVDTKVPYTPIIAAWIPQSEAPQEIIVKKPKHVVMGDAGPVEPDGINNKDSGSGRYS